MVGIDNRKDKGWIWELESSYFIDISQKMPTHRYFEANIILKGTKIDEIEDRRRPEFATSAQQTNLSPQCFRMQTRFIISANCSLPGRGSAVVKSYKAKF